jgi:galactose mutarotase-like enzyme
MGRYSALLRNIISPVAATTYELTDEEAGIRAAVAPAFGGELCSLQCRLASGWLEVLYRANDFSPTDDWRGRAPFLWPAVGRNFTQEQIDEARRTGIEPETGRYRIEDKEYEMPCHGFVMNQPWQLVSCEAKNDRAEAVCALESGDYSRPFYPFDVRLEARYVLRKGVLSVRFTVHASPGNPTPMPFSVGNHISLNFPFMARSGRDAVSNRLPESGAEWETGFLRGTARNGFGLTELSLLDGTSFGWGFRTGQSLKDPALCNAVIGEFEGGPSFLDLVQPGCLKVRITQRPLTKRLIRRHRYFVLWGDRERGYFCPEPWLGVPNSLNTGVGLVRLSPGTRFIWEFRVKVAGAHPGGETCPLHRDQAKPAEGTRSACERPGSGTPAVRDRLRSLL